MMKNRHKNLIKRYIDGEKKLYGRMMAILELYDNEDVEEESKVYIEYLKALDEDNIPKALDFKKKISSITL